MKSFIIVVVIGLLCFLSNNVEGASELARKTILSSKFNWAEKVITVSGLSSGGYMAVQMHVSFSKVCLPNGEKSNVYVYKTFYSNLFIKKFNNHFFFKYIS